jgi:hypothetical protein
MNQTEKITKLLTALKEIDSYNEADKELNLKYRGKYATIINRRELRMIIQRELFYNDAHTINNLITKLLSLGAIQPNPTSELTKHEFLKPSNDTRYFIAPIMIDIQLDLLQKSNPHTHTTLDTYINSINSEGNNACLSVPERINAESGCQNPKEAKIGNSD